MDMHLIVACDLNWNIGLGGELLFRISEDLKRFKAVTMGHPIIYGRRTLESFPNGRPLPGRTNLVLSRRPGFSVEGATVVPDLKSLFAALRQIGDPTPYLIGGGDVFAQLLPYCSSANVTRVLEVFPADVRFPDLDAHPDWTLVEQGEQRHADGLDFRYDCYHNRNPLPLP